MPGLRYYIWDLVQHVLGSPDFKRKLYRSALLRPGRVLDFGCATGHVADVLADFEYYGLDIDPAAVEMARQRLPRRDNVHLLAADISSRPFQADFFDAILFAGTVHHVDDQTLGVVLRELHYCLKPGCSIHLFDPVLRDSDGWQQRLMRRIDRGRYPRTVSQIETAVSSLNLFQMSVPTFHPPHGALLRDCDFVYLELHKTPRPSDSPATEAATE
jgi:SAM-dependent methyltransferase